MVAVTSKVTVVFDRDMDETTITTATFTIAVKGGAAVSGTVAYDKTTRSATFTPSANLSYSTTYTASLTTGIKSSTTTPIAAALSWDFTTAPRTLQFGTVRDDDPAGVAVDSSGNVYVAGSTKGSFASFTNQGDYDVFLTKYDKSGGLQWVRQFGTASADIAGGVAVDASGNVYISGATAGNLAVINVGSYDIFLAKFDTNGNQLWVKQFGSSGTDISTAVAVGSGGIYIAGYTNGTLPGSMVASAGRFDAFAAKYDASGNQIWVTQVGSAGDDYANALVLDASDNLYLGGETTGQLAGATLTGSKDAFLAKLDVNGNFVLARQNGVAGATTRALGVAFDRNAGVVYLAGTSSGSLAAGESGTIFLTAYKSDGTAVSGWPKQLGAAIDDTLTGITLDASGNIYLTGYTAGAFTGFTNAGSDDVFLAKYGANATRSYVYQFGTPQQDRGFALLQDSVTTSIYLAGSTKGGLDGNTNADVNKSSTDTFVTLHNPATGVRF
jgi:hypothetical protein